MLGLQPNQVCKVRNDAIGSTGKGYSYAIFKSASKESARIMLLDNDWTETRVTTVKMHFLWVMKAAMRKAIEAKCRKAQAELADALDDLTCNEPPPDNDTPFRLKVDEQVTYDNLKCVTRFVLKETGTELMIAHDGVANFIGSGAIVNAANEGMLGGGGVDGEISNRGGDALYQARLASPLVPGQQYIRCLTGDAKITIAGDIECDHVIHAVGPNFHMFRDEEEAKGLFRSAYENAMKRAQE
ncbi:MAG: macro domain-containing protein, partial [Actinomycetota bacterium]|nr:macro domain-containing protein [Actinomycetota bacterium]